MPPAILAILAKAIRSRAFWAGLVAIALMTTIGLQHRKIGGLRQTIQTLERTIGELTGRVKDDARKITQRDALIAEQNQAVVRMAEKSLEDEKAYRARIDQANRKAARLEAQVAKVDAFKPSNPEDAAVTQRELLTMIRETVAEYQKERADVR